MVQILRQVGANAAPFRVAYKGDWRVHPARIGSDPIALNLVRMIKRREPHYDAEDGLQWEVDHKLALILGGANSEDNLKCLCEWCHATKTGADIAQKAKSIEPRSGTAAFSRRAEPSSRGPALAPMAVAAAAPNRTSSGPVLTRRLDSSGR